MNFNHNILLVVYFIISLCFVYKTQQYIKMDKEKQRVIDLTVDELKLLFLDPLFSEIMNIEQCAKFIHKETNTVYQYVSKKQIPFKKKNGSLYFLRSEILEWISNGK